MIYGITGHRTITAYDAVKIRNTIADLEVVPKGFVFGGAIGADTEALIQAVKLWPGVKRIVVLPNTIKDQPQVAQEAIIKWATETIELKNPILRSNNWLAYDIRNREVVRMGEMLIAFWNGNRSGTYNAIKHAILMRKPYISVRIEGK